MSRNPVPDLDQTLDRGVLDPGEIFEPDKMNAKKSYMASYSIPRCVSL